MSSKAAFQPISPQHDLLPSGIPLQMHCPLLNCRRVLSDPFSSLSSSLRMVPQLPRASASLPHFASPASLLRGHTIPLPTSLMRILNGEGPTDPSPGLHHLRFASKRTLGHLSQASGPSPSAMLHSTSLAPLQPIRSRMIYEDLTGDTDKGFIQVQLNHGHRSPLVQYPVALTWKTQMTVKHDFPLENPCRPLLINFLSFLGLAAHSGKNLSIVPPRNKGSLTTLSFPTSSPFIF